MNSQGSRSRGQKNAQTRIGGEICESDVIMHKGHLTLCQCPEKNIQSRQISFLVFVCPPLRIDYKGISVEGD